MGRIDPEWGLVVVEPRHLTTALTALGAGTRDSAYTQDGAQPGTPAPTDSGSRWRPAASTAQSVELDVRSVRGGYAGRQGAEVLYRLGTDTDDADYRGWCEPNLVTGWSAGVSYTQGMDTWGASVTWDTVVSCVTVDGVIVLAAVDDSAGVGQVWQYHCRTGAWVVGAAFAAGSPGLSGPIGIVYDPDEDRVILYSGADPTTGVRRTAFASDDAGLTFEPYARGFTGGVGSGLGAYRFAVRPGGGEWLMFAVSVTTGASASALQSVSSDRGSTWETVDGLVDLADEDAFWPVWTGASFLVAYTNASDLACVRLLASARAQFSAAAEIEVSTAQTVRVVVPVVDADGTIYLYCSLYATPNTLEDLAVYRSVDGGLTWERYYANAISGGSTSQWYEWGGAQASCGAVFLVGVGRGNTNTDGTIAVLRLGGWSQVAAGAGGLVVVMGATDAYNHQWRVAWGGTWADTSIEARVYFPIGRPDEHGWTNHSGSGSTGTSLSSSAADALRQTIASGSAREWVYTASAAKSSVMFEAEVFVFGAATRATALAAAGGDVHATLRLSDASTFEYDVIVHFCSDGIALEDGNSGATIESIALTTGSASPSYPLTWTRVRVQLVAGRVDWWYAQGTGDLAEVWVKGTGGTVSNGAAATQSRVVWGVSAIAALNTVAWRLVAVAFGGEWQHGIEALADYDQSYTDGVRGHQLGRPIPGRTSPYPVPELTADDESIGYLSATGGPTYLGEVVVLPVGYTFPVEALHAMESPSPRDRWQATGTAEVLLVYDLAAAQWYGDALALLVIGGRPREWVLETDDGSTGWTTVGTLDLAVGSSLTYTRTGGVVVPNGGSAVSRFVRENELAGGYLVSGSAAAEIEANSAGWWGGSNRQQLRITLAEVGSFGASGTDLTIVSPAGLLVAYPTSVVVRRYVRIRAASGATVPGGKYGAGIVALGRVVGVGAEPAWSWTEERQLQVRRSRSSDGVTRAREQGPPVRRISYSWPEYQDLGKLRDAVEYVAASGGLPIGMGEDSAMLGDLFSVLRSTEVPVVVVPRLPTATGVLLDRAAFVYGRVVVDTLGVTGRYGTEGIDETVTVGTLTVDELR